MRFAAPFVPSAPSAANAAAELLHALEGWKALAGAGRTALSAGNVEALARALEAREGLRAHVEQVTGRLRREGGLTPSRAREIARLADDVAAADAALVRSLEEERGRIRKELDALRRGTDTAAAYLRPESPSPHRLDIVR